MATERIGLEAILLTEQFEKGLKIYLDGTLRMEQQTDRVADQTAARTEEMAQRQEKALERVGLAFSAVGAAGTALLTSLAMTASRSEELGVILDVTATNARRLAEAQGDSARASELSAEAVEGQVQAVKELGITTQASSLLVAQMIRYNLDWQRSTELAALAQDAATFAAQDSSEALQGLIHGITTLNPRVLRTYGIMINLDQAYSRFADANGRVSTSLSQTEKVNIAFNEVMGQSAAIAGAYEAAMDTASKQIRSLTRDVTEVSEEFGEFFVPVLNLAVGGLRSLLKWLRDLPDPIQATAVQALAMGSALSAVTGALILAIPKIQSAIKALRDLTIVQQLASAGLLGPVGIVAGLATAAGVALLYAQNLETARREEAASVIETADSYDNYLLQLEAAGLGSRALSEDLYEMAQAAREAGEAFDAIAFQEAAEDLDDVLEKLRVQREQWDNLAIGIDVAEDAGQGWSEWVRGAVGELSDLQLDMLGNVDAMTQWAIKAGEDADAAREWAEQMAELAQQERVLRQLEEARFTSIGDHEERMLGLVRAEREYEDTLRENINWTEILAQRERARYDNLVRLAQAERDYADQASTAVEDAAERMVDAEENAAEKRQDARERLVDSLNKLERDHARRVEEILAALAEVDVDLADDILEAERRVAQQRQDLAEELARALEEAERDYAEDRRDEAEDLARDLEALQRDHQERLTRIDERYLQERADLAEEYGQRLASIQEKYAREIENIEEKYRTEPAPITFDEQREALLAELARLRELQAEGTNISYDEQIRLVKEQLDALKEEELAALEERKQAELDELAAWLAEEQAVQDEAHEAALAAERERYERSKAERQADYDRRLEDLRRQHEAEKAEIQRRHQERLGELDQQLAEERRRLEQAAAEQRQRLQEQLADEQQNYADRRAELAAHYQDQLATIAESLAEEKAQIRESLAERLANIVEGLGDESQAFRDAYQQQLEDLDAYLTDRLERERQYQRELQALFEIQSPSRWMERLGEELTAGLERGLGDGIGGALTTRFEGAQSSIQTPLAVGPTMLQPPEIRLPQAAPTSVTNTSDTHLNIDAHYARPQSERRLRDDLYNIQLMMRARGRY